MKLLLAIIFIFPLFCNAQKINFIGNYQHKINEDNIVYVYLSIDSFKIVDVHLIQDGNNISVIVKSGTWDLYAKNGRYNINGLFRFKDGTTKSVQIYSGEGISDYGEPIKGIKHIVIDAQTFTIDFFNFIDIKARLKNRSIN